MQYFILQILPSGKAKTPFQSSPHRRDHKQLRKECLSLVEKDFSKLGRTIQEKQASLDAQAGRQPAQAIKSAANYDTRAELTL
jgi:hypothetical protein